MMDDFQKKVTELLSSPEIQGCIKALDSILGYKLTAEDKEPFLYFHKFATNPQPEFITSWRADKQTEKWYHKFCNSMSGDVQNSISCVLYHYDRLLEIENKVLKEIERYDYKKVLKDTTLSPGSTLIWDFEYQAFILSFRRCLDYLARAICTYFKNDFNNFRKLGDFLKNLNRPIATKSIIQCHEKFTSAFDFVLSEGTRKSVRDKISHYEYVPVGCINLSSRGFVLAGGGENLNLGANNNDLLSNILEKHVTNLRGCIREMIYAYVNSIILDQNTKNKK